MTRREKKDLLVTIAKSINVRKEPKWREPAHQAIGSVRWLLRAMKLYGRGKVVRIIRASDDGYGEAAAWLDYLDRFERGEGPNRIPLGVLFDPLSIVDRVAPELALAPRVGSALSAAA